jgi:hypothetical protein
MNLTGCAAASFAPVSDPNEPNVTIVAACTFRREGQKPGFRCALRKGLGIARLGAFHYQCTYDQLANEPTVGRDIGSGRG